MELARLVTEQAKEPAVLPQEREVALRHPHDYQCGDRGMETKRLAGPEPEHDPAVFVHMDHAHPEFDRSPLHLLRWPL